MDATVTTRHPASYRVCLVFPSALSSIACVLLQRVVCVLVLTYIATHSTTATRDMNAIKRTRAEVLTLGFSRVYTKSVAVVTFKWEEDKLPVILAAT